MLLYTVRRAMIGWGDAYRLRQDDQTDRRGTTAAGTRATEMTTEKTTTNCALKGQSRKILIPFFDIYG
jgi:hypothetical protein